MNKRGICIHLKNKLKKKPKLWTYACVRLCKQINGEGEVQ